MSDSTETADLVDRIQREWMRRYPGHDARPIAVLGRIARIAALSGHRLDLNLDRYGISRSEFDVLGALARSDRPLRASEVVSTTMLSGASITKLGDALARRGLLRREKSERDGRVVLLALTDDGRRLVDEVFPLRLADDERALAALSPQERDVLADLLRKVSASVEV